ncbi:YuzD family protein [Alteribacillus sp. HJP-4]|uniref:YuzD family protein n=1 Tax=Alteribacillus sp. HJP-4 TaxID=2775394 RepID=UPI0035CD2617
MKKPISIKIFGAEKKCPSCVNLPSSMETKEWLEAALTRKYPQRSFHFEYIDIEKGQAGSDKDIVDRIEEEELFYPLVTIEDEIVAEGIPRLKLLYKKIETLP